MAGHAPIYTRLSRGHDGAHDTLATQERDARARAATEGLKVIEVYNEGAGRSAYGAKGRDRRPVFDRMLRELEPGDVVIARNMDRISRDAEHSLGILRVLRDRGAFLLTLWDGVDTRRDSSALTPGVRALLAEEESAEKSRRVRSKQRSTRDAGRWPTGWPPFGLAIVVEREPAPDRRGSFIVEPGAPDVGKLRPCPRWGEVARRAVRIYLQEGGARQVAAYLNEQGAPTGLTGAQWQAPVVRRWLASPALAGLLPHRGEPYRHSVTGDLVSCGEGLVTVAEWMEMRRVRQERTTVAKDGRPRSKGRPGRSLLAGLVFCGHCRRPLSILRKPDQRPLYRCRSQGDVVVPCPGVGLVAEVLEGMVTERAIADLDRILGHLDAMEATDTDPDSLAVALAAELIERWSAEVDPNGKATRTEAELELAEVDARLRMLEDERFLGELDEPAYRRLRRRLVERRDSAAARLESLPAPAADMDRLRAVVLAPEALTTEDRKRVLHVLIDRVEVTSAGARRRWADPRERVTVRTVIDAVLDAGA
jgi:site-specific DNA recombinase